MLFKKSLLIALSLIAFARLTAHDATCNPKTTEIFWDIHKVIIKKSVKEMFDTFFYIFYNTPKNLALFGYIFNWQLIKDLYAIRKRGSSGEAYMERLKEEDPRLADLVLKMANSQVLIDGMEDLILKLADQGYTMYVASNIGSQVFEHLKTKYPHIFNDTVIKDGKTVDFKSENPVEKPDAQFFIELSSLRDEQKPHAIFIDDKQENVDAANANGFIGILFKDAAQLAQDLS